MRLLTLLLLMVCLCPSAVSGQAADPPVIPPPVASPDAASTADQEPRGPSLKSRIGRMFTGAVVGGWVGYFASHIAVSNWEKDADFMRGRGAWALGGVVLGVVTGQFAFNGGSGRVDDMRPDFAAARQVISREEIIEAGAVSAYDLVRSLRKEWLIPRGVNSIRETARGRASMTQELDVVPGADHVLVYLDNARLGGTQNLSEIAAQSLAEAEFIPPAEATFRWGTGHAHGVILLTTMGVQIKR